MTDHPSASVWGECRVNEQTGGRSSSSPSREVEDGPPETHTWTYTPFSSPTSPRSFPSCTHTPPLPLALEAPGPQRAVFQSFPRGLAWDPRTGVACHPTPPAPQAHLQLVVDLGHSLDFVAQLREAGAQAGHLLSPLVSDVRLVRIDLPQEQVHIHESLVELLLQHLQPPEHGHPTGGDPHGARGAPGPPSGSSRARSARRHGAA